MARRRRKLSPAKQRQLDMLVKQLAKQANEHHQQVIRHCQGLLNEARQSGEALWRIRWETYNWRKVGWKRWCNDKRNLDFGYGTVKVYCRIYRTWNKPEMAKARAEGGIRSIAAYLKILRLVQAGKQKPVSQFEASVCQEIRQWFGQWLRTKSPEEQEVLWRNPDYYFGIMDPKLYDNTCVMLGFDLDEYLLEKSERKLKQWERKNSKRRRPFQNIPKWVIELYMRRARVEERKETHKKFVQKVKKSLNRWRKPA